MPHWLKAQEDMQRDKSGSASVRLIVHHDTLRTRPLSVRLVYAFSLPLFTLSLSVSPSFFLPSSFSFFVFPSLFYACPVCLLCFLEKNKLNLSHVKAFFHLSILVFCFPVLLCFQIPFHLRCSSYLKLCFLFNNKVFVLQKGQIIQHHFGAFGGLQHNGLCFITCVLTCEKLSLFWPGKVMLMFKTR